MDQGTRYPKSCDSSVMTLKKVLSIVGMGVVVTLVSCSRGGTQQHRNEPVPVEDARGGLVIPAGTLPVLDDEGQYRLPGGALVASARVQGESFMRVHGTLSQSSFSALEQNASSRRLTLAERSDLLGHSLQASLKTIAHSVPVRTTRIDPEVGYFSAWIKVEDYPSLSRIRDLPAGILINPVVVDEFQVPRLPDSVDSQGLDGRLDSAGFSGLERIGAVEFSQMVESETGLRPDGASVLVGVADTGLTLNHPSFFDEKGVSRVDYLADYTGEGAAYFSQDTRFSIRLPNENGEELPKGVSRKEALYLTADYILAPQGMVTLPSADRLGSVEDKLILVNERLRSALTQSGHGARLGAIAESSFSTALEPVDINKNGRTDDVFWLIAFPGATSDDSQVYLDFSGTGDFRHSLPLSDWNRTRETLPVFAERVGIEFETVEVLSSSKDGEAVSVLRASLVGYDPGNHGSHVSGIILGRKTIANDPEHSLARGVAPAARLAFARVCANNSGCDETSAIIDLAKRNVDVINLSLGGLGAFNDGFDVGSLIVDRLALLYDTQFMISAGNSGPGRNTVGAPSVARTALSIGATATPSMIERQYQWPGKGSGSESIGAQDDFLLFFSSRGPTAAGGFKPTLTAPGSELSAVQLNAAAGARAGLDVYWGTSMASPTAAGAYALLLDAVRIYNAGDFGKKLPEDASSLRRALIESARAFDVTRFDPQTGEKLSGQYTWIDQGAGMIDLPAAWKVLKTMAESRVPPSFVMDAVAGDAASGKVPVVLDYSVRVLRKSPNGIDYSGTLGSFQPIGLDPEIGTPGARYGQGIWIDHSQVDTLTEVQIGRRLPEMLNLRSDAGDLHRQLVTTADEFVFDIVYFGSHTEWLRAGTLNSASCKDSSLASRVRVIGEGAIDVPGDETQPGSSVALRASSLYVCVDRAKTSALPPGDHGAFIKAYRIVGDQRESVMSFIVPVYLTIPNLKLADAQSFQTSGAVGSFQVKRHYVEIPEGTTLARVRVSVPEAQVSGSVVEGCSGVSLFVLEGGNTRVPPEFSERGRSLARSCADDGSPESSAQAREIVFERNSPTPGIWDLHVFGRYNFQKSDYTLEVDYANIRSTLARIEGGAENLQGSFGFQIESASFDVRPSEELSVFNLNGYAQKVTDSVQQGLAVRVKDLEGKAFRRYDADVQSVTVETNGAPKDDIDLQILECDGESEESECVTVASSGNATDEETASFEPKTDKYYVFEVVGYRVEAGETNFNLQQTLLLKDSEKGTLKLSGEVSSGFEVVYSFDVDDSKILSGARFTAGQYSAVGHLTIRSESGSLLTQVGVSVSKPIGNSDLLSSAGRSSF